MAKNFCQDYYQFSSEADAIAKFAIYGLSEKSKKNYKPVYCEYCEFWHLIHAEDQIVGDDEQDS